MPLLGSRPDGGYSGKVLRVRERGAGLEVVYKELILRGCVVTQAVTWHWFVVVVPKRDGLVTARVKPKIHRCR